MNGGIVWNDLFQVHVSALVFIQKIAVVNFEPHIVDVFIVYNAAGVSLQIKLKRISMLKSCITFLLTGTQKRADGTQNIKTDPVNCWIHGLEKI